MPGDQPSNAQSGSQSELNSHTNLSVTINRLDSGAPFRWLDKAWHDLVASRFQGLFYGGIFVLMSYLISWQYATKWQLTMGLVSGFFLVGPFICTGLYDLSRQLEVDGKARLLPSFSCWRRNIGSIAFFSIVLTFAMIVWARVSVILFALSSNTSFPDLKGVLGMIFSFDNPQFVMLWAGVGFVFASLVFAISVVSVPLMLDRRADTMMAVFASFRALQKNPRPMYIWAALIVVVIGISMLAGYIPLLLTAPLIGHATWHAYREVIAD